MVDYERELWIVSTESKIIEIDIDFAEKVKIKMETIFWNHKSRFLLKLN